LLGLGEMDIWDHEDMVKKVLDVSDLFLGKEFYLFAWNAVSFLK
jgi:hypothetical protein